MSLDHLDTLPAGKGPPGDDDLIQFGGRVDRYLILDRVGRGGMGVVYAAYDSMLDRRIALKIMRASTGEDASSGRVRMEREAQALARLSHENIVTVHDVGEHAGSMYIAMELVDGTTLREWQKSRPWREILRAYLDAARGLAAAHEGGLVHRDFKPENVLVDKDGDIRVTDFGLARRAGDAVQGAVPKHLSPSAFDSDLTAAGTVMGTVGYMALEQIEGRAVDERTDQYSWCIATWEGLFGEQPFVSGNIEARAEAMKSTVPKPPAKPAVPRAIVRVLQRGLSPEPKDRWPSVSAMIAELERVLSSRRWMVAASCFAGVAVIAGVFAIGQSSGAREADACASVASDPAWTPAMKAKVASAFSATGAPYADDAVRELATAIDGWQARWHGIALDSCVATRRQHTQSEQTQELRTACLARKHDELATLLGGLAQADRKAVEAAATIALPDLDTCNDPVALAGVVAPPRDVAARHAIETALEPVEQALLGGIGIERSKELLGKLPDATKLGWQPLIARVAMTRAKLEEELGHGKKARTAYLDAAAAAAAAGDGDALVEAYLDAAHVETRVTSEFALGKSWLGLARGTLARLGSRPKKQLHLSHATGDLYLREGQLEDARTAFREELAQATALGGGVPEIRALTDLGNSESQLNAIADAKQHLERALVLAKASIGENHPMTGAIYHELGTVVFRDGRFADALPLFETAVKIRSAAFGADSVEAANSIQACGNVLIEMDRPEDAAKKFALAIELFTARLGPDHPDVATAYNDIGGVYHRAGDYEKALANAQRVKAIRERVLGPDHPDVAESLVNEAIEAKNLGRWEIVNANYPRALAIYETKFGKDSLEVGVTQINLGEALRAQGRLDGAEKAYLVARDIIAKDLGEDHPMLGHAWNGLGQVALARNQKDEAKQLLERAVAIRSKSTMDATDLAESKFALARSLPDADAARAKQLASEAAAVYKVSGPGYAKRYSEITAWLAGK